MLRVISGSAKGHKLKTLKGMATRPTSDRVKESLFNIISPYLDRAVVLDLFAGTGSLGIEALSRGAEKCVFFDKNNKCCDLIKENLAHTKLADRAEVYASDYAAGIERLHLEHRKFDIVFLDPPYNKYFIQDTLKMLANNDIISCGGIIVAEHSCLDSLPEASGRFAAMDCRKYGDTSITIYAVRKEALR